LNFFTARVDDYNGIEGVVRGLVALYRRAAHSVTGGAAACTTARAVFNQVRVQALAQGTRYLFFQLFEMLLDDALVRDELGGEFVHGFIQAIDGEKDPRNLMLAFTLVDRVMSAPVRDWKRYAEDLFEVSSCYFPITFRHQPDDPDAVTQDQLVVALRQCLTHYSLASFAVPFLLEKLEESVPGTQRECVVTLVEILRRAKADGGDATAVLARGEPPVSDEAGQLLVEGVTEVHAAAIGSAVMAQIVAGRDTALVDGCVHAIAVACDALSRGIQVDAQPQSLLANFLAQIVPLAASNVERDAALPRVRLDSGRAVAACCRGSEASCLTVLKDVLKPLLARQHSAVPTVRRADVSLAAAIAEAISERLHRGGGDARMHPLMPYRDSLFELFRSTLLHDPTSGARAAAVSGVGALAAAGSPALLDDTARASAVAIVAHHLLADAHSDVRRAALTFLCNVLSQGARSVAHAAVLARVLADTVPALLSRVPEALLVDAPVRAAGTQGASGDDGSDRERPTRALAALAELAQTDEQVFEAIVGPLAAQACQCVVALTADENVDDDEPVHAVALAHILQCINVACGRAVPKSRAALHGEAAIVQPLIAALQQRAAATPNRLNSASMTQLIATVTGRVNVLDDDGRRRVRDSLGLARLEAVVRDGTPSQHQAVQLVCAIVRATSRSCGLPSERDALLAAAIEALRNVRCAGDVQLALTYVLALIVNAVDTIEPPRELVTLAAAGNIAAAAALVWAAQGGDGARRRVGALAARRHDFARAAVRRAVDARARAHARRVGGGVWHRAVRRRRARARRREAAVQAEVL
jgi:DNA repair/transcription protein MET18/MMS19